MEWLWILVVVLAAPIILLPVAFVWYLNVSGLYRVFSDARQRNKNRSEARRYAKERLVQEASIRETR